MKYVFLRYGKILFLFLAITDLLFIAFQKDFLRLFTKPLLMLVLAVYVMYLPAAKNKNTWLIISGLLFAAAGDTLLMFENSNANMFIFWFSKFLNYPFALYPLFYKNPTSQTNSFKTKPNYWIVTARLYY